MQAYEEKKDKGLLPVQFREGRATWRDFDSLLPDAGGRASLTLQNALRLMKASVPGVPRALLVLGLKYEPPNANVSFWRMERFALPEALREDRFVREEIRKLLIAAKEAESSLWSASQSFARDLIGRGEHKPDKKAVAAFVKQMPISPWYWSALEARFNDALREFTTASDFDDIRGRWLTSVRETLGAAWAQHSVTVSTGDAWAIRALARADGLIRRKLKELDQEIALLQPRAEGA
jgi:CRISPR system Cascade subunit CasA